MTTGLDECTHLEDTAVSRRALAAWYRFEGAEHGPLAAMPDAAYCGEISYEGRQYAIVGQQHKILAVYRLKNDGKLRRLKRWPRVFDAAVQVEYR